MSKKISDYGVKVLDELESDRNAFRDGKIEIQCAQTIATLANSTSRAMRETVLAKKFENAVSLATT